MAAEKQSKKSSVLDKIMNVSSVVEAGLHRVLAAVEEKAQGLLDRIKKKLLRVALEVLFATLAVGFLVGSLVVFMHRFFAYDIILLIAGLVCLIISLFFKIAQRR